QSPKLLPVMSIEVKHLWLLRLGIKNNPRFFSRARGIRMTFTRRIAGGSFIRLFLAVSAATVFADTGPVKTESQRNRSPTPALQSPAPKHGLNFAVGERGLTSLEFNGQLLLTSAENGELRPWKSGFGTLLDALFGSASSSTRAPAKRPDTVDLIYPWGRVSCMYGKQGDKITMGIEISNSGAKKIDELSVRLMELNFPAVPKGGTLEAGM